MNYKSLLAIIFVSIHAQDFFDITINGSVRQPDKKIIAAGNVFTMKDAEGLLVRYTENYLRDLSFGNNGIIRLPLDTKAVFNAVSVQPDNKIVAAGFVGNDPSKFLVSRFNSNGTLDSSFGTAGIVKTEIGESAQINGMALQDDGKIVTAGFSIVSGLRICTLARYKPNGQLDQNFGTGGIVSTEINYCQINDVLIQPDGKILVGGFSTIEDESRSLVVRYNTNGTPDNTFGTNGIQIIELGKESHINSLVLQSDNNIITAGTADNDFVALRLTPSGSLDTTFNATGIVRTNVFNTDTFTKVIIDKSDNIVCAGHFNGVANANIVLQRLEPNGSLDSTFGQNGTVITPMTAAQAQITGLFLQDDDKLIPVGSYDCGALLMRYDPTGLLDTGFGIDGIINNPANSFGCVSLLHEGTQRELVFTAFDFSNNTGRRPNKTFFASPAEIGSKKVASFAWVMFESSKIQKPISTTFSIPQNHLNETIEIDIHLLLDDDKTDGNKIALEVEVDFTEDGQDFLASVFDYIITSQDATVPSTSNGVAKHMVVRVSLPPNTQIPPKSLATIAIKRTAPSNPSEEYGRNIYLSSIAVRYRNTL